MGPTSPNEMWASVSFVEVVEGVADGVGGLAGGVLDGSGGLVDETFALELVVSGETACAFLELADEVAAGAGDALLGSPGAGFVGGVFDVVTGAGVLGGGCVGDDVDEQTEGHARDDPG